MIEVVGCVLAGGLSRRMGVEKAFIPLGGEPLILHVLHRLDRQVGRTILNANGDANRFRSIFEIIVPDTIVGAVGPLAGVLAAMEWTRANVPYANWVVTVACDSPFVPRNMVETMGQAVEQAGADMACARSGSRTHPVFGLWPVRLADDLHKAILEEGIRKVDIWTSRYKLIEVEFPVDNYDPFFNANTPDDIVKAQQILLDHRP
jgi:molybdopterin-guanine dinucleotide biosynthesis protein A